MCPESSTPGETSQALTADQLRTWTRRYAGVAEEAASALEAQAERITELESQAHLAEEGEFAGDLKFRNQQKLNESLRERIRELEEEVEALEERIEQVETDASQAIAQVRHQGFVAHREAQERADQERMDHENTRRRLRETERRR